MHDHQPEHRPPQLHKDQLRRVELALVAVILVLCALIAGVIAG